MAKHVIHISEAASDPESVMTRVREGAEAISERDAKPVAVVRPAEPTRGRSDVWHLRRSADSIRFPSASALG